MQPMNRRRLFTLAGTGAVLLAGAAVPTFGRPTVDHPDEVLRFRATLGLPQPPLPSYATYVIDGSLDLASGTGLVASRVLAGHPGAPSAIGLPGLGRIMQVTRVERQGAQLTLRGLIEDRSQLQPGENHQVELVIDQARGVLQAPFGSRSVVMTLV
jgi:hypothetical protein